MKNALGKMPLGKMSLAKLFLLPFRKIAPRLIPNLYAMKNSVMGI